MGLQDRRAKRLIRDLETGQIYRVVNDLMGWQKFFMRQASIPHNSEVILRVTVEGDLGEWYLWAIYEIVNVTQEMNEEPRVEYYLARLIAADGQEDALSIPPELEGREFFAA